jgi:O-antigen/teichoic acid export membrane protein
MEDSKKDLPTRRAQIARFYDCSCFPWRLFAFKRALGFERSAVEVEASLNVTIENGFNLSMRSRKKTTVLNLCFQAYSISMAFVSGVLLVPLYLHYIPSDLYGAWQASGNVLFWLTVLDPGVSAVLSQRVATAYGSGDTEGVAGWIASGFWITVGIGIIVLTAGLVASFFLGSWMNLPSGVDQCALVSAFRWSALGSAFMVLAYAVAAANQGIQSSLGIGSIYVVVTGVRLALVIILIKSGFGLLAIAIPSVVMGFLLLLGNLIYMRVRLKLEGMSFSWKPTRIRALGSCLSFTALGNCGAILANNLDLFFVARFLGPDNVNILRFSRTAPEMSRMLVERPFVAVQPTLAHLFGAGGMDRSREILLRMLRLAICLSILLVSGFALFNGDCVRLWVGGRFYAGTEVNLLIIGWFLIASSISVLSGLCFAAGNIRGNSLAGLAQVLLYLPLLWAGVHWLGTRGVVLAGILSIALTQGWYIPWAFSRIYRLKKENGIKLLETAAKAVIAATIAGVGFVCLQQPQNWLFFGLYAGSYSACFLLVLAVLSSDLRAEFLNGWTWIKSSRLFKNRRFIYKHS